MTASEHCASISLAGIFALRMPGLLQLLPVVAGHAKSMPGGDSTVLMQYDRPSSVFVMGSVLSLGWLIIAANMKNLPRRNPVQPAAV